MRISDRAFWAATFLAGCTIFSGGLAAREAVTTFAGPVRAPAVRAERFEVVDKTGRVLARIHARADGAVFAPGFADGGFAGGGATPPSAKPPGTPAGAGGGGDVRDALAAQQREAQSLQLRLDQERARFEQERIRREQERLRREQEQLRQEQERARARPPVGAYRPRG